MSKNRITRHVYTNRVKMSFYLDDETFSILRDYADRWCMSLSAGARQLILTLSWDSLPTTLIETPRGKCKERKLSLYPLQIQTMNTYKGEYSHSMVLTGLLREWRQEVSKR